MAEGSRWRGRGRGTAARAALRAVARLDRRAWRRHRAAAPAAVHLGPRTTVGPDVRFVLDDHGRTGGITIGGDAWLGRGVRVLPGVTIGAGAVVRSYSVVHDDVRPFAVVEGNPAAEVGRRFDDPVVDALLAIVWWDWDDATVAARADELRSVDLGAFVERYRPD